MTGVFSRLLAASAVASLVLVFPGGATTADAGASKYGKAKSSKGKSKVLGSSQRIGGYSYTYEDSIIDFRDRSVFLDSSTYDPPGPFDSGFFFESGVERQNDSPYLN